MSVSPQFGLVHFETEKSSVDAPRFQDYLRNCLDKIMSHPDYCKYAKHFLIMDNASVHFNKPVEELLLGYPEIELRLLPCYSPMLNPIEEVWSVTKHIRAGLAQRQAETSTTEETKSELLTRINMEEIAKAIKHVDLELINKMDGHVPEFYMPMLDLTDIHLTRRPENIPPPAYFDAPKEPEKRKSSTDRPRREANERRFTDDNPASILTQRKLINEQKRKIDDAIDKSSNKKVCHREEEDFDD